MKILIVTDYRTGGAGHVAQITGDILISRGFEVEYLFGTDFFKFSLMRYLFNFRGYNIVNGKLFSFKPDVVMLHNFDNIWSPLILKAVEKFKLVNDKAKVVMTLHDYHIISATNSLTYYNNENQLHYFDRVPSFIELIKNRIDRRGRLHGFVRIFQWYFYYGLLKLNSTIDSFICPSKFMMNKCIQRYSEKKVKVIYNPTTFINSNRVKFVGDSLQIIFAGRISQEKGIFEFFDLLIKSKLKINRKLHFDIIGDGDLFTELKNIAGKAQFSLSIHGRKSHEFVENKLTNANFVLLPSTVFENAPLSLIEGVFKGCNIITMNYGGMKEISEQLSSSILLDNLTQNSIDKMLKYLDSFDDSKSNENQREALLKKYTSSEYCRLIEDEF
ncbi:glycosyltransferase [Vibrio crassostreae]|uniref:glycosyltransferase n=1 Tax=Vibrio crassostreae TaxID=246167 RepID=UPI001B306714|nr:glycosyltransferase [Vibrio crassostreae]